MVRTDEELVAAAQGGEVRAFEILVGRWDHKIRGAIFRIVGSQDEAQELSQEAFFKAYRALPAFRGESRFSSWLYRIAINLSRDRLRRRRVRPTVSLDSPAGSGALATEDRRARAALERVDLRRTVATAIARLSPEQREVIVLKEYEGFTFAEVADALGEPVSTVKTRLYRALTQLRSELGGPVRALQAEGARPEPAGDVS